MNELDINKIVDHEDKIWFTPWVEETEIRDILKKENKQFVKELGRTPVPSEYGGLTYLVFGDYTSGKEHDVVVFGRLEENKLLDYDKPLVRVHSSCRSSELFHASNCECREELDIAMRTMAKEKIGVIIYLNQEGAGNGITAKLSAYKNSFDWNGNKVVSKIDNKTNRPTDVYQEYVALGYKPENRDFTIAAEILKRIGVKSIRLMTNNPAKIQGLKSQGIDVEPVSIHVKPTNEIIKRHLKAKKAKLGHNI